MEKKSFWILGVDVGSVSVSMVLADRDGNIGYKAYAFHHGDIPGTLKKMFSEIDEEKRPLAVVTTGRAKGYFPAKAHYDEKIALIAALRHLHPEARSALVVGGEKFGLIRFDEKGAYQSYRGNTSCAAGTGSFLDQQAGRLGLLSGASALAEIADANEGDPPKIASRCAVFAKTDLIHAQQEGHSRSAICDGLCQGLAHNVVDTVLPDGSWVGPLVMVGGVAKNSAVLRHIEGLLGEKVKTDPHAPVMGALGAALHYLAAGVFPKKASPWPPEVEIRKQEAGPESHHPPLTLKLSPWPEFGGRESFIFKPSAPEAPDVEVDIYENLEGLENPSLVLGVDIGSTSTKAVLARLTGEVFAGLYTRTQGRPVVAICAVLEAIDQVQKNFGLSFDILGCATTGSGRKFVGGILGADLILDEITAHARAACALDPEVDTIIEIGGQDAKFTTLKDGRVTSSIMNNVCAAGTGSFIEEQAQKLGVPISDYAKLTHNVAAPLSSDRCTVFMERDLNHNLAEGASVEEVLASALHAVRENYLLKVATESRIGERVFFQGATAKNRSLVAAFEQRLNRPILVSRYCHLTGALGCGLALLENLPEKSAFKGISIYGEPIPIRNEVCELCANHCKLTVAEVGGSQVAYGFLCGRDYETENYVNKNKAGFSLAQSRRKALRFQPLTAEDSDVRIGIPAALHLYEDVLFWRVFFDKLGFPVVDSRDFKEGVRSGKELAGAEFCAPVTGVHGHAAWLLERADYVFLPFYFQTKESKNQQRRLYCYYTQFVPALVSGINPERILRPRLKYLYPDLHSKMELHRILKNISRRNIGFFEISRAWDEAVKVQEHAARELVEAGKGALSGSDIRVLLLGRPYNVLPSWANKGIPEIFESLGVKPYFHDMLPAQVEKKDGIRPLIDMVHWRYAARVLSAVEKVCDVPGLYPVFITTFKCAPDSFILDYAKGVLETMGKPYLVLELDEHDSNVGYETRIEAAVRSFRNHHAGRESAAKILPSFEKINPDLAPSLEGKTMVLPNWDPITCRLLAANLKKEGLSVILLEETEETIRKGLRFNTGQCIPVNAITEAYVSTIARYNLEPEDTVLWMMSSDIACNIKLYPHHIKSLLARYGERYAKAGVYVGDIAFMEISLKAAFNSYFAYFFGGLLRKLACKTRPGEQVPGMTDAVLEKSIQVMEKAFLNEKDKEDAAKEVAAMFSSIPRDGVPRTKVAIFGDIYVRDNDIMNQDLVRFIESHGGEVITTPYTDYGRMAANVYFRKWFNEGKYKSLISYRSMLAALPRLEARYYRHFEELLGEQRQDYNEPPENILSEYGVPIENNGESLDNLLKVFYLHQNHPDLGLFVQVSPAFCCASLITEAMAGRIEEQTGVPVVSITYDGTGGLRNQDIIPYLAFPRQAAE